jgi:predicted Zn-dependent protease
MKEESERQRDLAVRTIVEEQKRLSSTHTRLATYAHRLCGKELAPSTGAAYLSKTSSDLSPSYEKLYGIREIPTVLFVLNDGPASVAGLQPRDVITHINDQPVPTMERFGEIYRTLGAADPIRMSIVRNGTAMPVEIKPQKACRYPALLSPDQMPDAFTDGERVVVTRGMMAFARDDFELSLVLAHEIAHVAMHHEDAKLKNIVADLFVKILAAVTPEEQALTGLVSSTHVASYSQEFEAEADYIGLYVLAMARLPFEEAPKFWRRMAAASPSRIKTNIGGSHPSTSYRMLALEATVREIKDKMKRGQPIEPNMKDEGTPGFTEF